MGEAGGENLLGFVENNPVGVTDPLGLCAPKKCKLDPSVINVKGGWVWDPKAGALVYAFRVTFTYSKDPDSDKGCCQYVQYATGSMVVDGRKMTEAKSGMPLDGTEHVDKTPWKDDTLNGLKGGPYNNGDTSGNGYQADDEPGIRQDLKSGDTVAFSFTFRLVVIDTCNSNEQVAEKKFKVDAVGTLPAPKVVPPPLKTAK
jgi:hypothetical protein